MLLAGIFWAFGYKPFYLLALYYVFRSARLLVWWLFRDEPAEVTRDPAVARVRKIRAWTAPAISLAILVPFASASEVLDEIGERVGTFVIAPLLFIVSATAVVTLLVVRAAPDERPVLRAALRIPLRKLGYYVGGSLLAFVLVGVIIAVLPEEITEFTWPIIAALAAICWLVLVFLFASGRVVRTGFGLAAVHPALPALLTGILVWECFAVSGLPGGPPAPVRFLLLVCGPVIVSGIAWWEIHRLRARHGVTLRRRRPAEHAGPHRRHVEEPEVSEPFSLPDGLPAPADDGAADHLPGTAMPSISLPATDGTTVDLAALGSGRTVIYIYPLTGRPGVDLPTGWDEIPGARGCTPESCGFRDHHRELRAAGATAVYGLSSQDIAYQREAVTRLDLPFAMLSDPRHRVATALRLPTFEVDGMVLYKRLTLVVTDGAIEHAFYPVFPPDAHAAEVLDWLRR